MPYVLLCYIISRTIIHILSGVVQCTGINTQHALIYKHLLFCSGIGTCENRHISNRLTPIVSLFLAVRQEIGIQKSQSGPAGIKERSGVGFETEKERGYRMGSRKESVG